MDLTLPRTHAIPAGLEPQDVRLLEALRDGLPLVPHPYAEIGAHAGLTEDEVVARIGRLLEQGVIKRFGVVVRHHELGYSANAMVVFDVPDERVDELGRCLGQFDFVTLCYQRARSLPHWPYNLYCMIHGRDPAAVRAKVDRIVESCGLGAIRHEVLFSRRRFKQCGAVYRHSAAADLASPASC